MFPDWLQNIFRNSSHIGQFVKKSIWFCTSSLLVLILPILVQLEITQVNELQTAQTREVKQNERNFLGENLFFD